MDIAGIAGVGLDEQGNLVGYIQMCDHHVDGATFYDTAGFNGTNNGSWTAPEAVTGFATWSLADPANGWKSSEPYSRPRGDHEYSLYGWTTDNSWSAEHLTFHLSDLVDLAPGEVLYTHLGELTQSTEEVFRTTACSV